MSKRRTGADLGAHRPPLPPTRRLTVAVPSAAEGGRSRDGGIETFWTCLATFEDIQLETTHGFTEAGPRSCIEHGPHAGREGIRVIARSTLVFTVENGQMTREWLFQERAEALEAAGLQE